MDSAAAPDRFTSSSFSDASRFRWDGPLAPIRRAIDGNGLAGAVVGVALPDGSIAREAVGLADFASQRAMTPDALFWIASLTKAMTSTLVMILVDEGNLELDRPVESYLPEFRDQRAAGWFGRATKPGRPVAVVDLMRHLSGLPAELPTEKRLLDRMTSEEKARLAASTRLVASPGRKIGYSNLNYECLGRLIEIAAGAPFEKALAERLLEPLGMRKTTFHPTAEQCERLALPHARDGRTGALERRSFILLSEPFDDPTRSPMPSCGLFSTVADCLRFCRLHLGRGELDGRRVFSEAAAERMLAPFDRPAAARYQGVAWSLSGGAACISGMYGTWMTLHLRHGGASVFLSASADFQAGPVWSACHAFADAVGEELAKLGREKHREAQRLRREEQHARREARRAARRSPASPSDD